MVEDIRNESEVFMVPASLQRKSKEPKKQLQFSVPLSWWKELSTLSRDFDQDVSTFLREATEDWLKRARRAKRQIEG